MIHYRYSRYGSSFGIEHRFDAGDRLPVHAHEPDYGHSVQVLSGRAVLRVDGQLSRELAPADGEVSFEYTRPHTLVGVESGTIVFNRLTPCPTDWPARLQREGDWRCL